MHFFFGLLGFHRSGWAVVSGDGLEVKGFGEARGVTGRCDEFLRQR